MSASSKNERIEAYIEEHYTTRINVVSGQAEIAPLGSECFVPISKFELNSLRRKIDKETGLLTSSDNLRAIVESDFSPRINPVKEYFYNLPRLDPQNNHHIARLAATVEVKEPKYWLEYLGKWLIGVAANALSDDKCLNHLCLVLCGEQGRRKSQWLDRLCPESLAQYRFTGKIDPSPTNKDVLMFVAERLIVNIDDQLRELNKKDENSLKNLITMPNVQYRRPYDVYPTAYPHLASFCASVNGADFLTDPTGSRRFLPFEVVDINIEATKRINMDNVYGEAMFLLESGYRYWFDDKEVAQLHRISTAFHAQTTEYELLVRRCEPSDKGEFRTTAEIISLLRGSTSMVLREKQMGEALRKAGFPRVSKRVNKMPLYGYLVKLVEEK